MTFDNRSLRLAGALTAKRRRLNVVHGPSEFTWRKLITHVECVLQDSKQVIVIVAAAGDDPRLPSNCDIANARLAALVVAKQPRNIVRRKRIRVLLRYPKYVQVEIETNIKETLEQVTAYAASAREDELEPTLPTPVLGYLLTR